MRRWGSGSPGRRALASGGVWTPGGLELAWCLPGKALKAETLSSLALGIPAPSVPTLLGDRVWHVQPENPRVLLITKFSLMKLQTALNAGRKIHPHPVSSTQEFTALCN